MQKMRIMGEAEQFKDMALVQAQALDLCDHVHDRVEQWTGQAANWV